MAIYHAILSIETKEAIDIVDITEKVESVVGSTGVQNGVVAVFVEHTTAAIRINEWEEGFLQDLRDLLQALVPQQAEYRHDDLSCRDPTTMDEKEEECVNGHAHLQQILAGNTSETIPLKGGKMRLGRWQRILLLELSDPRKREVIVTVLGD